MIEIKCPQCKKWNFGRPEHCTHCNHSFFEKEKKELMERKSWKEFSMPVIKINPEDSPLLNFFKHIIRIHQLIFLAIVYFVVYMMVGFSG